MNADGRRWGKGKPERKAGFLPLFLFLLVVLVAGAALMVAGGICLLVGRDVLGTCLLFGGIAGWVVVPLAVIFSIKK